MSSVNLALRYLIIVAAWHLACAWAQTFQSPYPIADAFELAGTAEEQLFKSLGISWRNLGAAASKAALISLLDAGFSLAMSGSAHLLAIGRSLPAFLSNYQFRRTGSI